MMLKIILYAYANRIYSARQIAKQLGENIYFMWLSRNQHPDFRTINRFRSNRMKNAIYQTFFSIVDILCKEGLVKLEDYYFDGTKIEANANRYTFVWKKSTEKYDQKLDEKYKQILLTIEEVMKEDERELDFQDKLEANPITSEKIDYCGRIVPLMHSFEPFIAIKRATLCGLGIIYATLAIGPRYGQELSQWWRTNDFTLPLE